MNIGDHPLDISIAHLLHNNLIGLFKSRPESRGAPPHFPSSENASEKNSPSANDMQSYCDASSANLNIVLSTAAMVEHSIENLLICPLGALSEKPISVTDRALSIFKEELSRISSLHRYLEYYAKIYTTQIKKLISEKEWCCISLLFDIRHMIIHASVFRGKFIEEQEQAYIYVDDPSYVKMLNRIISLMCMNKDYYCLPYSIFDWSDLIDCLVLNVSSAIDKVVKHSRQVFPDTNFKILPIPVKSWNSGEGDGS